MEIEYTFTLKGSFEIGPGDIKSMCVKSVEDIKEFLVWECYEEMSASEKPLENFTVTEIDKVVAEIQERGQ